MSKSNRLSSDDTYKSGYVAVVGAPNAGKSTLLNRLLGEKISITSKKPQTTRNRILGVMHRPGSQIIFIDTPGVHKANNPLNERIVGVALGALADVDVILAMVDVDHPDSEGEKVLLDALRKQTKPVVLALNKIDRIAKPEILRFIEHWSTAFPFKAVVPISALRDIQIDTLIVKMEEILAPGPPFFPPDTLTDITERFLAGEMIREKVFRLTGQEIPYACAVTVETFKEQKQGKLITIDATIHLERSSQKGIVIGKGGQKLKQIGEAARREIERMTGTQVFLKLFVRIEKNWRKDTKALRKFGY